jgi:predicted NodU family carbamoyl transferase
MPCLRLLIRTLPSSAILVHDGKVVAAVEQERLDRIKHSNKRCGEAIRRCLEIYGVRPEEVDAFSYYGDEMGGDLMLKNLYLNYPEIENPRSLRSLLSYNLAADLGIVPDPAKLHL